MCEYDCKGTDIWYLKQIVEEFLNMIVHCCLLVHPETVQ